MEWQFLPLWSTIRPHRAGARPGNSNPAAYAAGSPVALAAQEETKAMSSRLRWVLFLLGALMPTLPGAAQQPDEVSARPLRTLTRRELDRREAVYLYGL